MIIIPPGIKFLDEDPTGWLVIPPELLAPGRGFYRMLIQADKINKWGKSSERSHFWEINSKGSLPQMSTFLNIEIWKHYKNKPDPALLGFAYTGTILMLSCTCSTSMYCSWRTSILHGLCSCILNYMIINKLDAWIDRSSEPLVQNVLFCFILSLLWYFPFLEDTVQYIILTF
jgi:hypothetical protein